MAALFSYLAFGDSKREIRILTLTAISPLKGRLQTVSLAAELPQYTALSYTWKDPIYSLSEQELDWSELESIEVDGRLLKITRNLANALYCLFERKECRLWIDAICIDQGNLRERGDQVGLMRSIYTRAKKVIVWLGPHSHDSDLAMDHLALLAQGASESNRSEWFSSLADTKYYKAWEAFQNLLRRNWWKRAWVIQEVALAREVEVACGDRRISETQLMRVQQLLTECWYIIFPTNVIQALGLNSRKLEPMLALLRMRIYLQQGRTLGRLPILFLTRESLASDPRDLLFAKYGLMGEKGTALCAPDYTVPFETICRKFALAYILREQDLSILCHAGVSSSEQNKTFPTWLPYWGPSKPAYPLKCSWGGQATDWPKYKAALDTAPKVELFDEGRILEAEGVLADTIDGVQFDPWYHGSSDYKDASQSTSLITAFGTQAEAFEALYRTTVADTHRREAPLDPVPAEPEFGFLFAKACHDCEQLLDELQELPGFIPTAARPGASNIEKRWHGMRHLRLGGALIRDIVAEAYQSYVDNGEIADRRRSEFPLWRGFEHSFGQAMYHRRVFTTLGGYFGIASRTLASGDRICVLMGCALPLVIRPIAGSIHYQLVGECYIHGMMNGEVLKKVNAGKRVFTKISLC